MLFYLTFNVWGVGADGLKPKLAAKVADFIHGTTLCGKFLLFALHSPNFVWYD
jgi:hypothetical protein